MAKYVLIFLLFLYPMETSANNHIVQTDKTYTYEKLIDNLNQLRKRYKSHLKMKTIGYTHFGRKICAIRLGTGRKNVLLVGAHHGREWLTSLLLMKMLETYASATECHALVGKYHTDLLQEVSIWFVPMLNPDGVAIQQNDIHLFPSQVQNQFMYMNEGWDHYIRWKANGMGVDLNRQYPAGWNNLKTDQESPSYQFYKGKAPLEAAEAAALTHFVKEIHPSIAISYHSAGREIFWKYHNGKYSKRDRALAKRIAKITGYKLSKPPEDAIGGGFTDWFITTYHRPALTLEISYLVGDRDPPLSVLKNEWKRNYQVGLAIAEEAKRLEE